jgi:ABC-type multidrug transport system permease subunit
MGLLSTIFSLFAGFMIKPEDFPPFWIFVYYLDPLHYALEGLNTTQFYGDSTPIITRFGRTMTAEEYIKGR